MKTSKIRYEVNNFYKKAEEYRHELTDEEKLAEIDVTELFYREIEYMIKNGEIVKININAKMRMGKSTVGISLGYDIFQILKKCKMQPKDAKYSMKNIARDQQEESKMMRNPEMSFTVITTDEDNELERTGEHKMTLEPYWERIRRIREEKVKTKWKNTKEKTQ